MKPPRASPRCRPRPPPSIIAALQWSAECAPVIPFPPRSGPSRESSTTMSPPEHASSMFGEIAVRGFCVACAGTILAKPTSNCKRKISKIAFFFSPNPRVNRRVSAIAPLVGEFQQRLRRENYDVSAGATSNASGRSGFSSVGV